MVGLPSPLCTVTLYKGKAPVEVLRQRICSIVAANPWLAGRLVTDPQTNKVALWVPARPLAAPLLVEAAGSINLEELAYPELLQLALQHHVGSGSECLDTDRPLFRITVLSSGDGFCLVGSLCHGIADGSTYYQIYGMLAPTGSITSLAPERIMSFDTDRVEVMGSDKVDFMNSIGSFKRPEDEVLLSRVVGIDLEYVEQEKAKAAEEGTWISTNDVVTSLLLRLYQADSGHMMVNFRGRAPNVEAHHAGNYLGAVLLFKEDFEVATGLRKAVKTLRANSAVPANPVRKDWNHHAVTSWVAFHRDIELPGCELRSHFPILPPLIPSTVIFRPVEGRLCALVNAHPGAHEAMAAHPGIRPWSRSVPPEA